MLASPLGSAPPSTVESASLAVLPGTGLKPSSMPVAVAPLPAQLLRRPPKTTAQPQAASVNAPPPKNRVISPITPFPAPSGPPPTVQEAGASPRAETPAAPETATVSGPAPQAETPPLQTAFTAQEESVLLAVAGLEAKRAARRARAAGTTSERPARTGKDDPPGLGSLPSEVAQAASATPAALEKTALSQTGRRYTTGGTTPKSGFDCSGFTSFVYAQNGVELPRNSREQFQDGKPVAREQLQPGDLVFFGSKKRVNHVGIYLGEDKFIHSSSSGGSVRVSSLDEPVWEKLFAGGRRKI